VDLRQGGGLTVGGLGLPPFANAPPLPLTPVLLTSHRRVPEVNPSRERANPSGVVPPGAGGLPPPLLTHHLPLGEVRLPPKGAGGPPFGGDLRRIVSGKVRFAPSGEAYPKGGVDLLRRPSGGGGRLGGVR
jgi:hypothetical protein